MNKQEAIETMCRRCTNNEVCGGTGCEPKRVLAEPKYKEIEVNQAMQTANALKSLMCKTYCVNRVMVDGYEITKENLDNCCKNCPFAEIREVYY